MHRSLVALATTVACLASPAFAAAHHPDQASFKVTCTGLSAKFVGFSRGDLPVNWVVNVDGAAVTQGSFGPTVPRDPNGDIPLNVTYPTALTGPGAHTVVLKASWPTQGDINGTLTQVVKDCPAPTKPCPPTPPTPTPPVPCNCPPGPAGPAGPAGPPGVTTTITVVENHTTVVYVDKTCTSQRVFRLTIAKRLPRDDVFGEDAGQKIVGARITWRGAGADHKTLTKHATATLRLGTAHDTDEHHKRLRVNASFRNVIAPLGQVRVIDERITLANGHVLHVARKVRLCMGDGVGHGVRDGDLNGPSDLPQNGKSNGSAADEARAAAAKKPGYRKAVI